MKKFVSTLMLALALAFGVAAPAAYAAPTDDAKAAACESINGNTGAGTGSTCGDSGGVNRAIGAVINILSIIVGAAAIIMIIIAGLKYTTSGGDSSSISSAKNTLIYALVGLVVAVMAQFLVRFVLYSVTRP